MSDNDSKSQAEHLEISDEIRKAYENLDRREKITNIIQQVRKSFIFLLYPILTTCYALWYMHMCLTKCSHKENNDLAAIIVVIIGSWVAYIGVKQIWRYLLPISSLTLTVIIAGTMICGNPNDYLCVIDQKIGNKILIFPWKYSVQLFPKNKYYNTASQIISNKSGSNIRVYYSYRLELKANRDDIIKASKQWPNPTEILDLESKKLATRIINNWFSSMTDKDLRDLADETNIGANSVNISLYPNQFIPIGDKGQFKFTGISFTASW